MKRILILTVLCCICSFSIVAQIARELKSDAVINQQKEDRNQLLQDFYKLSDNPDLMVRGNPTVYKNENLEAIQFPVGGIGTGCIQFDGNAVPRFWQIFNNMTHDHISNSFFAVRMKNNDGVQVRALQTKNVAGFQKMAGLEASSKFPFISYRFKDEIPLEIQMDVFNPFIPTDLKNSEIPAVFYRFTIKNPTNDSVEVSLLAAQQNAVGFSKISKITEGDSFAERYQKSLDREPVIGNKSEYYGGNKNTIVSKGKSSMLLMEGNTDKLDEHFGQMALISLTQNVDIQGNANWEKGEGFNSYFNETGNIRTRIKIGKSKAGNTWTGALNSKIILAPGESKQINYALAWYFPNGLNGGHLQNWDAWGKGDWEGVDNNYANHWNDIEELSDYIIKNHCWLTETTEKFTNSFYETNLPFWLIERIGNQLSILKSRTIFHDKRGYVGLWEGCGSGDGSCAGNCNHVWHYAQAHARLFPEMGRKIKEQSFNAIKDDGQIPYRQPAGSPAFDGQCGDIIGAYREFLLSPNTEWLKKLYPNIKRAMNYLVEKHDPDKDGWLSDAPKHTTYDASMTGNPSFLASLYLTALKASVEMANVSGDNIQAKEWDLIAENSAKLQNEKLWNGEYFIQIPGEKRATDYENGCMSDQLLGQWWANQIGFGSMYPDYKIFSSTKAILKYNFKSNLLNHTQVARKFAKPEEAAMVGTTWPGNDRTSYASGYSDEIWTTYEYTIASSLLKYGELKDAMVLLRSGFDRYNGRLKTGYKTPNGWGNFGFSGNPFGDDECGQFYSRALSVWSVLIAAQGFEYNGPKGEIAFNPKWKPENHQLFFVTAEGWGSYSQELENGKQKSTIELSFGKLKLNQIKLNTNKENQSTVQVFLNDKKVDCTFSSNGKELLIKPGTLELKKDDNLKIINQ